MIQLNLKCLLVFLLALSCLVSCTTTSPNSSSSSDDLVLDSDGDDFTAGEDGDDASEGLTSDNTKDGTEDSDFANELDSDTPSDEDSGSSEFKDEEFAKDDLKEGDGELDSAGEKGEDPFANAPDEPQGVASEKLPIESASNEGESLEDGSNQNKNSISDIKFLANQAGGTVVVDTTGPAKYKTRVNESTNQFILEIANVNLPSRLKRPYIMKEFEGEFAAINAYQSAGSSTARIVVQMRNPGKALVQREGNSILVLPPTADNLAASVDDAEAGDAVNPEDAETAEEKEAKEASYDVQSAERDEKMLGAKSLEEYFSGDNRFYGRRLSIQTKDADVRDALNFIAEYSGVNMIISDDVTGTISLKLRQVPWDQALVTIMRSKRLGYIRQGNVIRISTLITLQAEADSSRAILESQKSLTPVRVKVIPVSYADVDSLTKQLGPFLSDKRGKIAFDNRTSSLIVTDTDEIINRIAKLVKSLDVPPLQVMIEGKIVEATEEFQRSVGVNWSFDGEKVNLSPSGGANGGPLDLRAGLSINPISRASLLGNPLALDLTVGRLDFLGELGAVLSLAETESTIKILSSPRIVTLNKESAQITQEGQVLTRSTVTDPTGNKKSSIERNPVTLNLTVTPQITAVGSVILSVLVKRQFATGIVDPESLARAINTREAKTKVLVDNGQTAVIGGVYQSDASQGETGVPVLKDIPVLGWLFKYRQRDSQKNELLIFLTPRVINFGEQGKQEDIETSSIYERMKLAVG